MATWACRKARQIIDNVPKIIGIELMLAARAIYVTEPQLGGFALGLGTDAVYRALREAIPFCPEDSYMPGQTGPAIRIATQGVALDLVERGIGPLQ